LLFRYIYPPPLLSLLTFLVVLTWQQAKFSRMNSHYFYDIFVHINVPCTSAVLGKILHTLFPLVTVNKASKCSFFSPLFQFPAWDVQLPVPPYQRSNTGRIKKLNETLVLLD
jgi:hypothetical protein